MAKQPAVKRDRDRDADDEQGDEPVAKKGRAEEGFAALMVKVQAYVQVALGLKTERRKKRAEGSRRRSGDFDEDDLSDFQESGYLTTSPPYLNGALRAYQIEGVNWLIHLHDSSLNGILADEMGLGKTFQTIALLGYLKHTLGVSGPHIVICPLSVLGNWCREFERWCPTISVLKFHGNKDERVDLRQEMKSQDHDVVVTTYDMVVREKTAFKGTHWEYIIVDEAHRMKNEESLLSQVLRLFTSKHRLLITGTPLQNNLHELWALLNFLLPSLFTEASEFDSWFDAREGKSETSVISQLHKMLAPFMLRRLKADVDTALPPKREIYVGCGLTKLQREWYTKILSKEGALVNNGSGNATRLMNIVMQLRKVCNHPYLFDGAEEPPFITDDSLVTNSGKMLLLDKLLKRLKTDGHRVLLFCQMTRMLDIIEDYLVYNNYDYCRLDGSTSPAQRDEAMNVFNAPDSPKFIFLLSTRAGGLGINLQTADTCILFDSDWNPQADLQAQDRCHRIGQKKPVTVLRLITDGTVEEKVYQRALKKLYLDAAVIQQGRLQEKMKAASKEELLSMVRFGAESIFKKAKEAGTVDTVTDEDIDIILARGERTQSELEQQLKKDAQMSLLNFKMGIDETNLYEFEGVSFSDKPTKQLYVKGIDGSVDETILREAFTPHGVISKVIISPKRDEACVILSDIKSAVGAYIALNQSRTIGECKEVHVSYGSKAAMNIVTAEAIIDAHTIKSQRARTNLVFGFPEDNTAKKIRLPKKPNFPAWQFYDMDKLISYWETECQAIQKAHDQKAAAKERRRQQKEELRQKRKREREMKLDGADAVETVSDEEPEEEDEPEAEVTGLTTRERAERDELLQNPFGKWSRFDFKQFLMGCERHGLGDPESIAADIGKPADEVARYAACIKERGQELPEWVKLQKKIERGEQLRKKREAFMGAVKWKAKQMKADVVPTRLGPWDEVEDRQLVLAAAQCEYGQTKEIMAKLLQDPALQFDWFVRSRSDKELLSRLEQISRQAERERALLEGKDLPPARQKVSTRSKK
eukprot:TRINITY_DN3546_c0_g1_i1.p1 TRINITY_DN3546_c0_g1~~TRINITY_DN3546_c0_g1_i1.p1  ORF type:complete len:1055 (+),score=207.89 TRINITY_DN3546_c0_g1_i1:41-3166(+)